MIGLQVRYAPKRLIAQSRRSFAEARSGHLGVPGGPEGVRRDGEGGAALGEPQGAARHGARGLALGLTGPET